MRVLKHSLLSLKRKPVKGVMIFAILILVFGLVFTGIIVRNSVTESKDYVRIKLGAVVTLTPDYLQFHLDGKEDYEELELTPQDVDMLDGDDRIKSIYTMKRAWVQAPALKSGREFGKEQEEEAVIDEEMMRFDSVHLDMMGSNHAVPLEFEMGKLTLSDGEYFSESQAESNDSIAIVSTQFASVNNLTVGDTFKVLSEKKMQETQNWDWEAEENKVEFTITGTYEATNVNQSDTVYVPMATAIDYTWEGQEDYIDGVHALLKDPMDVENFIADHEDELPSEYMQLTANDDMYKQLTQPLDLLEMITSLLIWVIFVAGAMIVLSIVTIFVRDRKFEVGLLLASGESKMNIVSQFVLEIFIVAIMAFLVSLGASHISSGFVGDWIVDNQLMNEEQSEQDKMLALQNTYNQTAGDITMETLAEDFDVALQAETVIRLFLVSMVVLLIAATIPLIVIMSYKPREALQD